MKMVNYKLCSIHYRINFAMIVYIQRKVEKWSHQTMQIKNVYGNAKQGMDDKVPIQIIPIILQKVWSKWDFIN
jgi:hypothetical protein